MSLNVITRAEFRARFRLRQGYGGQATIDNCRGKRRVSLSIESFANFGRELFGVERFGKEKHAGLAAIARLE